MTIPSFIAQLPKAELHVHIEGAIDGNRLFALADRNKITLPYKTPQDVLSLQDETKTGTHNNLINFLKCLDVSRGALRKGLDYYDIAMDYYSRCSDENIVYAEIMFDPQQAIRQGVAFEECFEALRQARKDAREHLNIESQWIMCFQRDHSLQSALDVLKQADPYRDDIVAIGLDNAETPGFPAIFAPLYDAARKRDYHLTSHCDVNQPDSLAHIRDCLGILKVERIDHGLNTMQDKTLVQEVIAKGIALTACPTHHVSQTSCPSDRLDMIKGLLNAGVLISLNTDDPAQFGSGWLSSTLASAQRGAGFSNADMTKFMENAFHSAWLPVADRDRYLEKLSSHSESNTKDSIN